MIRTFDVIVGITIILTFSVSVLLWVTGQQAEALLVAIWCAIITGVSIYVKLLRIVHFVLYKNLKKGED